MPNLVDRDPLSTVTTPDGVVIVARTRPVQMFHPDRRLETVPVVKWRTQPMSAELAERNMRIARANKGVSAPFWTPILPDPAPRPARERNDDLPTGVMHERMMAQYGGMPR
jgi:hypothetical protein